MLFGDHLVVLRGGGDLATGAVHHLVNAGFAVIVLELERPLVLRRPVSIASAVLEGEVTVDGIDAVLVDSMAAAVKAVQTGVVAVLISPELPDFVSPPSVLVDARVAKRNLDTSLDQAPLVVGLGPGLRAGHDCHAVVETKRGHRLGRVIWDGSAADDTGIPGQVGGVGAQRVVRAPGAGPVSWTVEIGDMVGSGQAMGAVGEAEVAAPIAGVVRGLIAPGHPAQSDLKIGDIDPRGDRSACFEISDKARLVGSGVLEAVLTWLNR
jgi:xanthine dehydrogenase accessory factor